MRLFHTDWVEIYLGTDHGAYLRKQTLLREAGLKYKAKVRKNKRRFTADFLVDAAGPQQKRPPIRDYYVILVRRENAVYAKSLLG